MNRRLYRSRTDSVIGGVAGGVAEYFDLDPSLVRVAWVVLALVSGGVFFVLYIVMWIVVPEAPPAPYRPAAGGTPEGPAPEAEPEAESGPPPMPPAEAGPGMQGWTAYGAGYGTSEPGPRRTTHGGLVFGLILILVGAWFLVDEFVPAIDTDILWPVALVVLGVVLLVVSMRRSGS